MHEVPAVRSIAAASVLSILVIVGALPGDGAMIVARQPQTAAEALTSDLEAIAEANGWTLRQARANHRSTRAVDHLVEAIEAERPGILVGSVLSPDPEGPPTIYIKGPTDAVIDGLVAGADVPILLIDDQPWSLDELDERSMRAQQALMALGVNVVNGGTDITRGGTLEVGVSRISGYTDAEVAAMLAALPDDLRSDVELTVIDPPIYALLCDVAAPAPSASPTASAAPAATSAAAAACLDLPPGWGPLAVVDDPAIGGLDAGLGPGRLSIGARCVTLRGGRGPGVTLVWRAGDTRWDPETREILFADRDLGLIRLSDGDRMTLGGATPSIVDAPDQGGPVLPPWIAMPDIACPGELWVVNDVSRQRH